MDTNRYRYLDTISCCDDTHEPHEKSQEETEQTDWVRVINKKRQQKIQSPCWFYNNGGCRHKNGHIKNENECKYLHIYANNVQRPPHLTSQKPCDKMNIEGVCKWRDQCKYSHRTLSESEWKEFYPDVPFMFRFHIQRRQYLEAKVQELESKLSILEYKINAMDTYYEDKCSKLENPLKTKRVEYKK